MATDGEGEGVVNAALPEPGRGVSGLGAKVRDHPMKIAAGRIRNKISLFSIYKLISATYKLISATPRVSMRYCAGIPMFNEPGHSRLG